MLELVQGVVVHASKQLPPTLMYTAMMPKHRICTTAAPAYQYGPATPCTPARRVTKEVTGCELGVRMLVDTVPHMDNVHMLMHATCLQVEYGRLR